MRTQDSEDAHPAETMPMHTTIANDASGPIGADYTTTQSAMARVGTQPAWPAPKRPQGRRQWQRRLPRRRISAALRFAQSCKQARAAAAIGGGYATVDAS